MNTLIVVPTYNGDEYIKNLSLSIKGLNLPVLYVDTILGGRDTGALIKAYKDYNFDSYFLMHDSMIVKSPFIDDFKDKFNNRIGAVGWLKFPINTCEWERKFIPETIEYPYGILGSIMLIKREVLDKLDDLGLLPPPSNSHKESEAWERGWPLVINHAGYGIDFIDDWDQDKIIRDEYKHFKKNFGGRL